jgi:hypothetical protein
MTKDKEIELIAKNIVFKVKDMILDTDDKYISNEEIQGVYVAFISLLCSFVGTMHNNQRKGDKLRDTIIKFMKDYKDDD